MPFEACGLLSGHNQIVRSIWQLENESKSDRRFLVGKKVVGETVAKIKKRNEQVLAVYHSHPTTAPIPSFYDINNHPDENVKMVIISYKLNSPLTKWYQIQGSTYKECLFWIKPQQPPDLL